MKTVYVGTDDEGIVRTQIKADSARGIILIESAERVVVRSKRALIDFAENGAVLQGDITIFGSVSIVGDLKVNGSTTTVGTLEAVGGCVGCNDPTA
jgi:hypothetical protein